MIKDDGLIASQSPNQIFNIHTGHMQLFNPQNIIETLISISGGGKKTACDIYLHWKFTRNTKYVVKKAWEHFPINGSRIPPEDIRKEFGIDNSNELDSYPIDSKHDQNNTRDLNISNRKFNIKHIVEKQGINCLCHFTHISNLASILENGLVTRLVIDNQDINTSVKINDEKRLDGHRNSISLSISFPNYRMFHKLSSDSKNKWVVICLKPDILWNFDCAFFPTNAASACSRNNNLEYYKNPSALEILFQDYESQNRIELNIPDRYTTNPQAEVLVFGNISTEHFMKICFYSEYEIQDWLKCHSTNRQNLFISKQECFRYRCDYKFWKKDNSSF